MLTLTKTMLQKSIIDCSAECRAFALEHGVDYENIDNGGRVVLDATWQDGTETELRFYRPANERKDRRLSIKGIKKYCEVGDTITMVDSRKGIVLIIT